MLHVVCGHVHGLYYAIQVDIIVALRMAKRSDKKEPQIAVLTPYKAQKELVEDLVSEKKLCVTVSTINESQGYYIYLTVCIVLANQVIMFYRE